MKFFWLLLVPFLAGASEIPQLLLPAGVGVNIHFVTGHQHDLDLIRDAGFKFIRMDFGWEGIERAKAQYDWSEYDELLSELDARGIHAVFILDYSHHLYESEVTSENPLTHRTHRTLASPQHEESVAAFARWAAASAAHYHGRHVIWEIWNEPNISFWNPKPDADQYTTLALATARAIRAAEPDATIVGPASSTFPWPFLETFLKSGILEYLDAVSVHPYRSPKRPPETAAADFQKLRELINRYAPESKRGHIPILSGEWGYSTWTHGVSLETQAAFIARQQLSNVLNGVPLSIWYDWKNDGNNPNENEHNFGTVLPDLQPKPAYVSVHTLTTELAGYRIVRRVASADPNDFILLCENSAGGRKVAAWAIADAHTIELPVTGDGTPTGVTSSGQRFTPQLQASQLRLDLTAQPQYISLNHCQLASP